jgi:hypothetical protein
VASGKVKAKVRLHPYGFILAVVLAAALLASILTGSPSTLPAVALDSPVLFCLERALAFFAAAFVLILVLVEAFKGNLPVEISDSGLRYERLKEETQAGLSALSEAVAEERKARLDAPSPHPMPVDRKDLSE